MRSAGPVARLALILLAASALAACQEGRAEGAKTSPTATPKAAVERPVLVAEVRYEPLTPARSFVATIRPRVESDLGFRVAGKVARRLVNVGDRVAAGAPLAHLDETDLRLQGEGAEAERRAAGANLAQAEAEWKRVTALRAEGWSTAAAQDRQRAAVEEARGRLARAERAAQLAANALSYATLTADADGVVTAALVEPGQVVAAGQPALRLARSAEKEAVVAVPESGVAGVREGRARLSLWSDPGRAYGATLRELSPAADPASRTYQARFALPDAGEAVQLGMTATLTVTAADERRAARLPLSALFSQGSGPALWTVSSEGALQLKPVTVLAYEARDVLIGGGVEPGERVVTLGVQKLDGGQRVRVVDALRF